MYLFIIINIYALVTIFLCNFIKKRRLFYMLHLYKVWYVIISKLESSNIILTLIFTNNIIPRFTHDPRFKISKYFGGYFNCFPNSHTIVKINWIIPVTQRVNNYEVPPIFFASGQTNSVLYIQTNNDAIKFSSRLPLSLRSYICRTR